MQQFRSLSELITHLQSIQAKVQLASPAKDTGVCTYEFPEVTVAFDEDLNEVEFS